MMQKAVRLGLRRLVAEDSGQDLVEYALICCLLALGSVILLKTFSTALSNLTLTLINRGAAAWPQ